VPVVGAKDGTAVGSVGISVGTGDGSVGRAVGSGVGSVGRAVGDAVGSRDTLSTNSQSQEPLSSVTLTKPSKFASPEVPHMLHETILDGPVTTRR
jgi:tRNA G37 N-methylase TrmD